MDKETSVAELVTSTMPLLSPTELRVARALLSDYPSAALSTVSDLAVAASSSTASVVRFCARLGFSGFSELQSRVRGELSRRGASPRSRADDARTPTAFGDAIQNRADLVLSAGTSVPESEWKRLVAVLADTHRTILLAGGTLSDLAARYLQLQLRHIRPRTHFLEDPLHRDLGFLLDARKGDVLIMFDFRRYEERSEQIATLAKEHGMQIVLFTDVWMSPIARLADIVIPLHVEASFLDSFTALFAVVETLVPATAAAIGDDALSRMEQVEETRKRY